MLSKNNTPTNAIGLPKETGIGQEVACVTQHETKEADDVSCRPFSFSPLLKRAFTFRFSDKCATWWCVRWLFFSNHCEARRMIRLYTNLWNKTVVYYEDTFCWIDFEPGEVHTAVVTEIDPNGSELDQATLWLLNSDDVTELVTKINIRGKVGPDRLINYWKKKK